MLSPGQPTGLFCETNGLSSIAELPLLVSGQQPGQALKGFGPIWLQAQGLPIGINRRRRLAFLGKRETEIIVSLGITRIAAQALVEVLNRLFKPPLFGESDSKKIIFLSVISLQSLHFREVEEGWRDVALVREIDGQIEMRSRISRIYPHRLQIVSYRFGNLSLVL